MSEELDELASAYVDGEASEEDISRVESDPALLDLVERFRSLRASNLPLPEPDIELRDRHISAALDTFDQLSLGDQAPSASVASQAAASQPADESNVTPFQRPQATSRSAPVQTANSKRSRWLLNAAAAVVLIGGVGFALTQLPNGDSGDSAALQTSDDAGEMAEPSASGAEASRAIDTDAAEQPTQAANSALAGDDASDGASNDDAMNDEAMSDDEAEAFEEEAAEEEAVDEADEETTEADTADRLPAFEVSGTETTDEVLVLAEQIGAMAGDLVTPDASPCFLSIDEPPAGIEFGFVTFLYGDTTAQLLIYDDGGTQQAIVVDAASCAVLATP